MFLSPFLCFALLERMHTDRLCTSRMSQESTPERLKGFAHQAGYLCVFWWKFYGDPRLLMPGLVSLSGAINGANWFLCKLASSSFVFCYCGEPDAWIGFVVAIYTSWLVRVPCPWSRSMLTACQPGMPRLCRMSHKRKGCVDWTGRRMHLLPLLVCSSFGGNSVGKQLICVSMSLCTFRCVLQMSPGFKQEIFMKPIMAPGLEWTDLCDLGHALLSPVSMGNSNVYSFFFINLVPQLLIKLCFRPQFSKQINSNHNFVIADLLPTFQKVVWLMIGQWFRPRARVTFKN